MSKWALDAIELIGVLAVGTGALLLQNPWDPALALVLFGGLIMGFPWGILFQRRVIHPSEEVNIEP